MTEGNKECSPSVVVPAGLKHHSPVVRKQQVYYRFLFLAVHLYDVDMPSLAESLREFQAFEHFGKQI